MGQHAKRVIVSGCGPVGAVMALIGAPVFIVLLRRQTR